MDNESSVQKTEAKTGFLSVIKKLWTNILAWNAVGMTGFAFYINIIVISNIFWPGEQFHAAEIGLLIGSGAWTVAFSGLLFGYLADRYSRKNLISIIVLVYGLGMFLFCLVPDGRGLTSYSLFLTCNIFCAFFAGGLYPTLNSYVNDRAEHAERSQFFGLMGATFNVTQIVGMLIAAFLFENGLWRIYFLIFGTVIVIAGLIVTIKMKEPERGAMESMLKVTLSKSDTKYEYKLTKETFKKTILAPTNLIAFFEGIFTTILLAIPDFLLIAYLQTEPLNLSPFTVAIIMAFFGLLGGVIGSIGFAKMSDKLAKKTIAFRLVLIVICLWTIFLFYLAMFFMPLPALTPDQGRNFILVISQPIVILIGVLMFIVFAVSSLYTINQPPILQKINLPEAQGFIGSANQFLEGFGYGIGPMLAGILLFLFNQNYQITAFVTICTGIIGALLWLAAMKWINKDIDRISGILKERANELNKK